MTPRARVSWRFILLNLAVWVAMVVILIVVPDSLERWCSLPVARVIGWAVAGSIWVVAVEQEWKARLGFFPRYVLQLLLWVGAALVAIWVSDQFRFVVMG